jgi:hypothetical protein
MSTLPSVQQQDPRTTAQRLADETAAAGAWEGFETEELLTEQGAAEILAHCRTFAMENAMDSYSALGHARGQPFRWKNKVYRIIRCDYVAGEAAVEATPADADFMAEVKRRLEADRFHTLNYYQGFGFICFPEDYAKYQD